MDAEGWKVWVSTDTEGEKNRSWGETGPCQAEGAPLPLPGKRIKAKMALVGQEKREERHSRGDGAAVLAVCSSLAEGRPGCRVVSLWWVGWVRAGICTLGQAPLAGKQEPVQRQAELMQRGPIVAGSADGIQLCWPLPRGSSREGGPALMEGWSSGTALTQEGNTPFMEAPRGLGSVPVRAIACARGGGEAPADAAPTAVRLRLNISKARWETRKEALGPCRAQAESQVLGSILCSALDSVRNLRQISSLWVSVPHLFSWNREL